MTQVAYLEETCKSALNRVARGGPLPYEWTINPYRGCAHNCHYCFARAYHSYLDLGIGDDFARRIVVKTNIAPVVRRELSSPRWAGEPVAMGTATDPYQPCEGRYRLTRDVLGALIEFRTPLSMLTKSTLIVRDIDLISRLASGPGATVAMSVGTLDDSIRQLIEPGTPPARSRLEVLGRCSSAGIRTGVLIAPTLPYLTDSEAMLNELVGACAGAGVRHVTGVVLHIRPGIAAHFWPWLEQALPTIYSRYRDLYGDRSHAPSAYRLSVAKRLSRACAWAGLENRAERLMPQPRAGGGVQLSLAV